MTKINIKYTYRIAKKYSQYQKLSVRLLRLLKQKSATKNFISKIKKLLFRLFRLEKQLQRLGLCITIGTSCLHLPNYLTAQVTSIGGEFLVNTSTQDSEFDPSVAMDNDGDFTITWLEFYNYFNYNTNSFYYSTSVVMQRFDNNANPLNGEILLNWSQGASTRGNVTEMDSSGDILCAWSAPPPYSYYSNDLNIYGKKFGNTGNQLYNFTIQNSSSFDVAAGIAANNQGDFILIYEKTGNVYGQLYNSSGTLLGNEFQINGGTHTSINSRVARNNAGDFVVVWKSEGQDGNGGGIYARLYNNLGIPSGSEFLVNNYTLGNQDYPDVAMDDLGNFVVAWQSEGQDGDLNGIYHKRFNSQGVPFGVESQVNSYTTNQQTKPKTSMDLNGNFVIVWESLFQDGNGSGIFAQAYLADGSTVGTEFQVNAYTQDGQFSPSIDMDDDGDFVIAWTSRYQDGSYDGVFAQRYKLNTFPCPANIVLGNTSEPGDTTYQASNIIESQQTILQNGNVTYSANNFVHLFPGFEVKQGADFTANNEGCNN